MSFQYVFNNCTTLSIDRLDVVAQTQSRNGIVKTVNRGTPKKTFTLQLPNGPFYADIKSDIEAMETLDRHTSSSISILYAKQPWYYGNVAPGSDETYTVICTQFPQWTVFGSQQVRWSGAFVFVEV